MTVTVTVTEYIFLPLRPLLSELDETIEAVDVGLLLWAIKHNIFMLSAQCLNKTTVQRPNPK